MSGIDVDNITARVIGHGDGGSSNPRLHEIYASLVKHLHAFQREVKLTTAELDIGRRFLFELSQPSRDFPLGELHLMTDCLGISELSILLEDSGAAHATEMNVEGPLFIEGLPERAQGARIGVDPAGEPLFVSHLFQDCAGRPLANAIVDVWQPDSAGFYFVQRDHLPEWNFYARLRTDAEGRLHYETVIPGDYPVPTQGPTGRLLEALGRHGYRAAHIHYIVRAEGHPDFTTMMYFNHSPYVESDTIFSVKNFRVDAVRHTEPAALRARGLDRPFSTVDCTFTIP